MPRFVNMYECFDYFDQILLLYLRYSKFLDDDYAYDSLPVNIYFENLIKRTSPYFFVIAEGNEAAGFVYLDNFTGNSQKLHCAELVTCISKKYWGEYTKKCAEIFIPFCLNVLNLKKIKTLVYPENFRTKALLKFAGFEKEALLKGETMRNNKMQDIEIYSCRKAEK